MENIFFQYYKDVENQLISSPSEISVINFLNHLLDHAYKSRASDIHIDPLEKGMKIRFRIDGVLQDIYTFQKSFLPEIVSRVKILCGLRTDEHQATQDGRFGHSFENKKIDIRVSIAPTYYGENIVLRLLADKMENFDLKSLGFSENNIAKIEKSLKKSWGMILATGPTGSGKTTTLYTLIKILNKKEVSIVTIEDPIEYNINGVTQIQVNPQTGLTFANGLRSVLRQDPNIIMVGEIRDFETANLAVNTALTGHLFLSTLHTTDSVTAIVRLIDMKIEPFLIASTVNLVIAQRLVRKICDACKTIYEISETEKQSLSEIFPKHLLKDTKNFYIGKGCPKCNFSGYIGRTSINEVLVVDEAIRESILLRHPSNKMKQVAISQGMIPMLEDGFQKALQSITTIEEVLRVINE